MALDLTSPFGTYNLSSRARIARELAQKTKCKKLVNLIRQLGGLRSVEVADIEVYGSQFRVMPQLNRCDKIVLGYPHLFDKKEREALKDFFEKKDYPTFLDIGANIGAYSAYAASLGVGKIVSVEAEPAMFKRLSFNLPNRNIVKLNRAVSDAEGVLPFYVHPTNSGENSLVPNGGERIEVAAMPLKHIITKHFESAPTAMKLDIEGMEFKVLHKFFEESDKSIWPEMILMEYIHSKYALEILLQKGYKEVEKTGMNIVVVKDDS